MELILNSYGSMLTKDTENFLITTPDGERQRIHPETLRSIQICRGAQISSDAVILAIQHEIDVLFVDAKGNPYGRIWSNRYGSVSTIRKNQISFTFSSHAVAWIKQILMEKIANQQALLLSLPVTDPALEKETDRAVAKMEDYRTKVAGITGEIVSDIAPSLRGWEGASSRLYFQIISKTLPEPYRFVQRSQNPAKDLFNCLLNYGYGMLYGKVESALIKAGIDPYVGVFHRDDYNRPGLVFDVIEKFRVWIDFVVIALVRQEVIDEDAYSVAADGSYWLEGLGKRILIQSVNDYLDEVIPIKAKQRSRISHLNDFAASFAQHLLQLKF